MANATVLNIGQADGAGADDALFLKLFGGEVIGAFEEVNVVRDKHIVRPITSGKSAQFPATWKVSAGYHTPGAEIVGQTANLNERVINVDDLLYASVFISDIDEAKSHFETRGEYARQCGFALSNEWDKNVIQVGVLAARAAATVSGGFGGTELTSSTTLYKTSGADLASGLYAAAQAMDEKDIPQGEAKYAFMLPAQYYLLSQTTNVINKDWGGNGSYASGKVGEIGGVMPVKTNHLPSTSISAVTGENNTYNGDFTKTAALVMTRHAVGTVLLRDLKQEMGWDMRRQGTLMIAKYLVGHGILRPECSVELKTTS